MKVLSLFDGISCGRLALHELGITLSEYLAFEVDEYAIQISMNNWNDVAQLGSVCNVYWERFKPDLVIGGSPCQGFSSGGNQLNFKDERSKLIVDFFKCIKVTQPRYFLLENVKMAKFCEQVISDKLGVNPVKINSDLFVPQNRERFYWTNLPMPPLPNRPNWKIKSFRPCAKSRSDDGSNYMQMKRGTYACLMTSISVQPTKARSRDSRLTVHECENLQGLPYDYTLGPSDTQRYKAIGNGWTVPVIKHILKPLKEAYK